MSTADSLQDVSTHAYVPTYFAVKLSMYTLIPTVYRALLNSAVSGTDHRIRTTKETYKGWATRSSTCVSGARHADFPDADRGRRRV